MNMMDLDDIYIKQDDGERRMVGYYREENKTLYCKREKSRHLFRKFNAWGLDYRTIQSLKIEKGLEKIKLYDEENSVAYQTNINTLDEYGKIRHFKPHRKQIFLPLKYWNQPS